MINVAKLEQELKTLQERAREINRLVQEHVAAIQLLRIEYRDLEGNVYDRQGKIPNKKRKIADAKIRNADEKAIRVVWLKDREDEYVVRKVTPKRIYIARIGSHQTNQYTRDGRRTHKSAPIVIDVEATFR